MINNNKLFITIDVEEDSWGIYDSETHLIDNVFELLKLHNLFTEFNSYPTYLVTYPVIANKKGQSLIKEVHDLGNCEIGTHLHPWNTPPLNETRSEANSMLCNLPADLVTEKIKTLHAEIENSIGVRPVCFRAGRWGVGPSVARSISELGYEVDTSISPFCDWTEYHGPDFSEASLAPYRFNPHNIFMEDKEGDLLEVPASVAFLQKNMGRAFNMRRWLANSKLSKLRVLGILDRLKLINLRWLSQELSSSRDMIKLAKAMMANGHKAFNMSFHSTSLLPGKSPFVQNEKELDGFMRKISSFLEFAVNNSFEFLPLSKAADIYVKSGKNGN